MAGRLSCHGRTTKRVSIACVYVLPPAQQAEIHLGNTRTAVINWLLAKRHGGEFMLRIDDTDLERSTEAYREGIEADLAGLV